jgi:hypothetical protein
MSILNRNHQLKSRAAGAMACLLALIGMTSCAGGVAEPSGAMHYPAGIGGDVENVLKYDSRVQDFEMDGDTLSVNVNDAWVEQPQGMHERALGQWYSLWKASRGEKARVVVKHGGDELETYTAEKGYQPVIKEKKESEG